MATFIWFFERSAPAPSTIDSPICTKALDSLLRMDDVDHLNRTMAASGGKPDAMAKLLMKHIKTEMQKSAIDNKRAKASIALPAGMQVLRPGSPAAPRLPGAGRVGTVTRLLELSAVQLCVHVGIKAELLLAFVNVSPQYSMVCPQHRKIILHIIERIVPRCLVYRTVINNVHAALAIAQASPYIASVFQSSVKGAWEAFVRVAEDRKAFERQSITLQAPAFVCNNTRVVIRKTLHRQL
ncbi:hypothetical protein FIBSPDRAFT_950039 [Athelia psychrophila]|uniref:Uncharacterized protein n=1 Tax=Athelia psychrophila TaxID=1759441 RepID=A0A166P2A9_9AGAM|nr:hypothetical protein FIBSPDRAFT_950039 [Fibularhizoctonia sp. CBS 109695]